MRTLHKGWKELVNDCILLIMVFGTIGIAVRFTTFFNQWVYFPSFPNLLDATFLIFSVTYLTWRIKK